MCVVGWNVRSRPLLSTEYLVFPTSYIADMRTAYAVNKDLIIRLINYEIIDGGVVQAERWYVRMLLLLLLLCGGWESCKV